VRNSISALPACREARLLSDIVKRRSIRALRVTEKSRAARYSRHFHRRKLRGMLTSAKLDRLAVGSIL